MTKILIFAYRIEHAEYYVHEVLHIGRSSWKFVKDDWDIRGCRGMELLLIEAPRYVPSMFQIEKRDHLIEACLALGVDIKKVELP